MKRPYQCHICDYSTWRVGFLRVHLLCDHDLGQKKVMEMYPN